MTNLDSILKSRDITLPTNVGLVKAMVFPVVMYGYESWTIKKAECRRIDAFELWKWRRLLRIPLTARRLNQSIQKGNQPWVFIGRTGAEAETPILWLPDEKSQLIRKDSEVGKDWRQEEKGTTEDEIVRWHHWLNGHGFGWTPGVGDRCYHSWGCKELKTTERLNWTEVFGPLDFIFSKYDYLNRVIIIRQVNVDKIIEMKSCGLLVLPFTC